MTRISLKVWSESAAELSRFLRPLALRPRLTTGLPLSTTCLQRRSGQAHSNLRNMLSGLDTPGDVGGSPGPQPTKDRGEQPRRAPEARVAMHEPSKNFALRVSPVLMQRVEELAAARGSSWTAVDQGGHRGGVDADGGRLERAGPARGVGVVVGGCRAGSVSAMKELLAYHRERRQGRGRMRWTSSTSSPSGGGGAPDAVEGWGTGEGRRSSDVRIHVLHSARHTPRGFEAPPGAARKEPQMSDPTQEIPAEGFEETTKAEASHEGDELARARKEAAAGA